MRHIAEHLLTLPCLIWQEGVRLPQCDTAIPAKPSVVGPDAARQRTYAPACLRQAERNKSSPHVGTMWQTVKSRLHLSGAGEASGSFLIHPLGGCACTLGAVLTSRGHAVR